MLGLLLADSFCFKLAFTKGLFLLELLGLLLSCSSHSAISCSYVRLLISAWITSWVLRNPAPRTAMLHPALSFYKTASSMGTQHLITDVMLVCLLLLTCHATRGPQPRAQQPRVPLDSLPNAARHANVPPDAGNAAPVTKSASHLQSAVPAVTQTGPAAARLHPVSVDTYQVVPLQSAPPRQHPAPRKHTPK